jgi:hypothetical protein
MKYALSPRETAIQFSIPHHVVRRLVREGLLVSHAVGRRSVILTNDVVEYIRTRPATTRPKRKSKCH